MCYVSSHPAEVPTGAQLGPGSWNKEMWDRAAWMLYKYPQFMLSKLDKSWLPTASWRQGVSCRGGASAKSGTGLFCFIGIVRDTCHHLTMEMGKEKSRGFWTTKPLPAICTGYTGWDAMFGYRLVKCVLQKCRHAILNWFFFWDWNTGGRLLPPHFTEDDACNVYVV